MEWEARIEQASKYRLLAKYRSYDWDSVVSLVSTSIIYLTVSFIKITILKLYLNDPILMPSLQAG